MRIRGIQTKTVHRLPFFLGQRCRRGRRPIRCRDIKAITTSSTKRSRSFSDQFVGIQACLHGIFWLLPTTNVSSFFMKPKLNFVWILWWFEHTPFGSLSLPGGNFGYNFPDFKCFSISLPTSAGISSHMLPNNSYLLTRMVTSSSIHAAWLPR